ncbi:calpain-B-like [Procambarus clarkii]|uniref:calpain-B-like n=1 Tax=Procambarus clarkii TaxID=6728 RepID=UPI001E670EE7|nr:calpain-A-like [Procambarus clarkii]
MGHERERLLVYRGQDFIRLRDRCRAEKRLFEDPEFPADDRSLGLDKVVSWKRPSELVGKPRFMDRADRFSVVQGDLGDCWLVSALSAITLNPGLLRRVAPSDQDFTTKYAGIFHFRVWQGGEWVDVVVDDRLPVNQIDQLCFSRSSNSCEFWSALLEKAYAKLHGSYGALNAGKSYEATEDLTGGVTERFLLQKETPPDNLFSIMVQASQRGSLITCNVPGKLGDISNGLVASHGYCVTGVRLCKVIITPWLSDVQLVRLRNPWGDDSEWRGAFSDDSEEWKLVPAEEKARLRLTTADDGEFWMTFQAFKDNFQEVFITSLNPQTLNSEAREHLHSLADVVTRIMHQPGEGGRAPPSQEEARERKVWEVVHYDGSWVRHVSAAGAPCNSNLFSSNPQYLLHLREADDEAGAAGTCTVVLSLTQKNRRVKNLPLLAITVCVYKVEEAEKVPSPLPASWFRINRPLLLTKFFKTRTVTHRLELLPGRYILIPCTATADQEGEFLLRVFCEKAATMQENDEDPMLLDTTHEAEDEVDANKEPSGESPGATIQKEEFLALAGKDGRVKAATLHNILNLLFSGILEFSLDLSRSLLAMMDRDLSGNVDFYEFKTLIRSLRRWVDVYDRKKAAESGLLSGRAWGLGDALKELGYQVPRRLQGLVVVRYGDQHGNISLSDFLMVTCRISVMLERFQMHISEEKDQAVIQLSEWLQDTLYC